jgi:putative ABC transport system permease protein
MRLRRVRPRVDVEILLGDASGRLRGLALASVSLCWGVAVLTLLSAVLDGYDRHFQARIHAIGPRIVYVFAGLDVDRRVGARLSRPVRLEREDVDAVLRLPSVEGASPSEPLGWRVVRSDRTARWLRVLAIDADGGDLRGIEAESGRGLGRLDVESGSRVALLGASAAQRLFGKADPVGRSIRVSGVRLRVVGVARARNEQLLDVFGSDDTTVFVTVTTAQRWLARTEHLGGFIFSPVSRDASRGTVDRVRALLSLRRELDPVGDTALHFLNSLDVTELIELLGLGVRVFLLGVSVITVAIGALGIANAVAASVSERTGEIGVRKAVGARDVDIIAEVLLEAVLAITVAGGAGLGLGLLGAALTGSESDRGLLAFSPVVDPRTAAWILITIVAVGLLAGVAPARRAARIDPGLALRRRPA